MAIDKNAPPSQNPANDDSMVGMFRQILNKFLQNVDDMLPAKIIAYDRTTNRAQVQPMIMIVSTNGDELSRAQVASVPVFQIGGGNFMLNFNLKEGDLGWLKANDRDISLFAQSGNNSAPNTARKHSFEDAVFFPDAMRNYTIAEEDEEHAVFQTLDGTVRVALWDDQVKITAPKITLDAPLTEITGQLIAGTNGDYDQTATFNGNITTTADVFAQTVSLHEHTHNGVQPGVGNTGEPNT